MNRLITTSDGSHSIFVPELNEHYHSVHGAVQESITVFIKNGYAFSNADPVKIFEVGFGTGLNALLTLYSSITDKRRTDYTTIEKYPIGEETLGLLNHSDFVGTDGKELFTLIHKASWGKKTILNDHFSLLKIEGDLLTFDTFDEYDLIYFDAFGPDKQPEMWSESILGKVAGSVKTGGIFVTYSAKGDVKRALKRCGFKVTLVPGPPGKRQMIRAIKTG